MNENTSSLKNNGDSIWTHNFKTLFFANLVSHMGSNLVSSLLPLYSRSLGASESMIGFITGCFVITALLVRPVSAPAIDSWNRKKLYSWVITINALCMFGYAFSESVTAIIMFRFLHGVSNGTSAALCLAMASEALPSEKLSSGVGTYMLSNVIPSAVGPAMGQFLSGAIGYRYTYIISGVLILLAVVVGFGLNYDGRETKKIKISWDTMIATEALVPGVVIMVLYFGSSTITSFITLLANDRGISGISAYYTILAVTMIVSRPIAGKIADKCGSDKVIYPCLGIFAANLVLLAYCQNTIELWIAAVLYGIGYSCAYTMIQALALKVSPGEKRGAASSTCYIFTDLGSAMGSSLAGIVAEHFGYTNMFLLGIIPVVISVIIFGLWFAKTQKTKIVIN